MDGSGTTDIFDLDEQQLLGYRWLQVEGDHCDFKHPLGIITITAKIAVKVLTARMPGNAFLD
jgi:hypothetical protein